MSDPIYAAGYHRDHADGPRPTKPICHRTTREIDISSLRTSPSIPKVNLAAPVMIRLSVSCALIIFSASCTGSKMKPSYSKADVYPLTVHKLPNDEISIRYHVYPESSHYSDGVDYIKSGNELKVVVDRCGIRDKCYPMAKTVIPLDGKWEAEVHIPYHGENVVLLHSDGEEHVYP